MTTYTRETEAEKRARLEQDLRPSELVMPGHEIPVDELSNRTDVGRLARLARENGWETKAGHSLVYSGDVLQVNWKIRLGKEFNFYWFEAVRDGIKIGATSLPHFNISRQMVTKERLEGRITQ